MPFLFNSSAPTRFRNSGISSPTLSPFWYDNGVLWATAPTSVWWYGDTYAGMYPVAFTSLLAFQHWTKSTWIDSTFAPIPASSYPPFVGPNDMPGMIVTTNTTQGICSSWNLCCAPGVVPFLPQVFSAMPPPSDPALGAGCVPGPVANGIGYSLTVSSPTGVQTVRVAYLLLGPTGTENPASSYFGVN